MIIPPANYRSKKDWLAHLGGLGWLAK